MRMPVRSKIGEHARERELELAVELGKRSVAHPWLEHA